MGKSANVTKLSKPVSGSDHFLGVPDAQITLLEYGDYECPLCGSAYTVIKQLLHKYEGRIKFVFRPYPLRQLHTHAQNAAEAAEAAAAQGKYWEYHDLLFKNQNELEDHHLIQYAQQAGLDLEQFQRDLSDHKFADRVRDDYRSGVQSGVVGTPGFFINDKRYEDSWDIHSLPRVIEESLNDND